MPVSETTIHNRANDYRSWFKLGIAGLVIILILLAVLIAFAVNRANQPAAGQAAPLGSLAAIDVSNPETATATLNTRLTEAVRNIDSEDPNSAISSLLNSLLGNTDGADTARIAFTYNVANAEGTVNVEFVGNIAGGDANGSLQGTATIHAQTTDTPDLTVPVDLILANKRMYLMVKAPTGDLPDDYAMLGLLEGKWLKIDLESLTSLTGGSEATAEDVLDTQKRNELLESWTKNPPFINPQSAPDRVVAGVTLQCLKAEMNPEAFKDVDTATDYPPTEICSNRGNAPVYLGMQMNQDGQNITVGITVFAFGEPVTITEPTEDVVDLSGLLGGL